MKFNIEKIMDNYRYIKELNLIDEEILNKILFGTYIKDEKEALKRLTEYIDDDYLPEYAGILNRDNKIMVRDIIAYLIINKCVGEDYDEYKHSVIRRYHKTNEDYIESLDNNIDSKLLDSVYQQYFIGITESLKNTLDRINPNFFKKIDSLDKTTKEFIDSLNTIKIWDSLEEQDRKERLKNEIIGRILYTCIEFILTLFNKHISKKDYLDTADLIFSISEIKLDDELLDNAKKIDINNELIINKVLEIYPYSFDMLRQYNDYKKENINDNYYIQANNYGYCFSKEEREYKNLKQIDNTSNYAFYIYNDINLKVIPYEEQLDYLINLNMYYNQYKNDKNEDNLYMFLLGLDLFIRNTNYYDKDIEKYNELSYKVFDRKMINQDRLDYIKVLVKKYYDITNNIILGTLLVREAPIHLKEFREDTYTNFVLLKDMYKFLVDSYGIYTLQINDILDNDEYFNLVTEYFEKNKDSITNNTLKDSEELTNILTTIAFISKQFYESNINDTLGIMKKDSAKIVNIINSICNANKQERYTMNVLTTFYLNTKVLDDE